MDPCDHCEEVMQPFLDRSLSLEEQVSVETHLETCPWCSKRFRFEQELRCYVRVACSEEMPPSLKAKLAALRTPLL
jgi:mycothiol system anti-sigma-R factor